MEGDYLDNTVNFLTPPNQRDFYSKKFWVLEVNPGDYAALEFNLYRCQGKSRRKCPHGPDCGPRRKHGGSGTAPIHRYHIEKAVTKMLASRGITKKNSTLRRGRNKSRPQVTLQIDKNTCLSYNHHINDYGYKGVPTKAMKTLLDRMANDFAVDIKCDIQPTHTFDLNAQDALYHAELKRQLRFRGLPENNDDLRNKFTDAVNWISLNTIQRGFIRSYSKDSKGDTDESLIPESLLGWYSDDEEMSEDDVPRVPK